jgi:integrase
MRNAALPISAVRSSIIMLMEEDAQIRAMNTIERRLHAIRRVHKLLGLSDPTDDEDVKLAFGKVRRSKLARPKRAKGQTSDYLKRFLEAQPDNLIGRRNKAMISVGYELLTRRSELVALRVEDLEFRSDGTIKAISHRGKADPFGYGRLAC